MTTTSTKATFPVKNFYNVKADVDYNFDFITTNTLQGDVNYTLTVTNLNGKVVSKNVSFNVNRPAMNVSVEYCNYSPGAASCHIGLKIEQEGVTDYTLLLHKIDFIGTDCSAISQPTPAQMQGDPGKYYAFGCSIM